MLCLTHPKFYLIICRVSIRRLLACDEKVVKRVADLLQLALVLIRIARCITCRTLLLNDGLVHVVCLTMRFGNDDWLLNICSVIDILACFNSPTGRSPQQWRRLLAK